MTKFYESVLDRISVKGLKRLMTLLLMACAVLAWAVFDNNGHIRGLGGIGRGGTPRFAGHEVAEWHITGPEKIRVRSRLTLSRCPANATLMPVSLPYDSGEIEAVTLDGQPIPWTKTGLELRLGLNTPGKALKQAVVEVTWSFPFAELIPEEDYYRIRLQPLIPVKSYALVAILEDDCGFNVIGDPTVKLTQPFGCVQKKYTTRIGTCGLMIRKQES